MAEALRSILPRVEALGLVAPGGIEIDTLASRLREEATTLRAGMPAPGMVGGFARRRD